MVVVQSDWGRIGFGASRRVQTAVVTGATRGIGFEVALALGSLGMRVVLAGRDSTLIDENVDIARAQDIDAYPGMLDVSDNRSVARFVECVLKRFGHVDILVNNAGILQEGNARDGFVTLLDQDLKALDETFSVNLFGPVMLTKLFLPSMIELHYGRIVNVSSGMGRFVELDQYAPFYRCSKAALNAFTRCVAAEVREFNVLVNAVCPGWVRTAMGTEEAVRSVTEGARGVVIAATLPNGGPSGQLLRDGENFGW